MKNIIIIQAVLYVFMLSNAVSQIKYNIDPVKSEFIWIGKKIGSQHKGNISISTGEMVIDKTDKIISGKFEVDMTSITCADITDKELNGKLIGHLKSPDFFDVATYPKATFTIKPGSKIQKGNTLIKGDLTIKGIKLPIEFKAMFMPSVGGYKVFANFSVDRSKYEVRYGSGSFFEDIGDSAIYDDFDVFLNLVLKKETNTANK